MAGLTARFVETVQPPEKGRKDHWDDDPKGLSLRVWRDSKDRTRKVWNFVYRSSGKWCRHRIGDYSKSLGLKDARKEANRLKREVSLGGDPAAERQQARQQAEVATVDVCTVRKVAAEFIETYAKKHQRSWDQTERVLKQHVLPAIGDRPIAEIRKREVVIALNGIARKHPILANRALAHTRKLFNWAVAQDIIEASPVAGIEAPSPEESRERVLTDSEIRDFWRATFLMGYPFGPMFRTLLLTGQRRSEVSGMQRPEWDDGETPTLWTIPGARTKNKLAHEVPLAPLAQAELAALPSFADVDSAFTSGYAGDRPVSGFGKAKERLDKFCRASEWSEDWIVHDLRRTFRTRLSECGVDPHIAERCVNHIDGGVRRVYDRHAYREEKRRAFEAWETRLREILAAAEKAIPAPSNVVRLAR
ncbi:site-specific integrase [Rhodospirillaceae bacterium SYSU D60014]|uniref:tyrosine-type recombinase/integrase n=1 Tax=Virgifigura deserti TaxID=2268457 RepID=UPI000E663352